MSRYPIMTRNDRAERARRIAARYAAGERAQDLAEEFGLSRPWVNKLCQIHGVPRPMGRPRGFKVMK